jgi:hypothetical protein
MKKLSLFLPVAFTAALLSNAALADSPATAPELRFRTEPALGCLLGFDSWGCEKRVFEGRTGRVARWMSRYCVKQYVDEERDYCPNGPLERVDYLGTNTAGADVYAVEYMHASSIYIIAPPGPDGRIDHVWIAGGHRNGVVPSSLVDIRPPAAHKITVYQRPWH